MPNFPGDVEIGVARRDAAIRALGLTSKDMISVTITPATATCVYLIRDDQHRPKLTIGGTVATRTVVHPFVNL